MNLEEEVRDVRYIRERIDLIVTEDGNVILPAWQFALFVHKFEEYRQTILNWFALTLLLVIMFLVLLWY